MNIQEKAIEHYGIKHQAIKAIEEMNEAAAAISRWINGLGSVERMAEELADVSIMIDQLELGVETLQELTEAWRLEKLQKLEKRIGEVQK